MFLPHPCLHAVNKPVPAAQSSPKWKPSVTGPIPPSNTPSVIHLDLTNSTDSTMSSGNSAWLTMISNLTRKQLSNISVPQVSVNPFQSTSIVSVCGLFNETDPLELHERPPEIVLEQADKIIGKKQGNGYPTGVVIPKLGTFSRTGITILKKFCKISSLKALIHSEERWLDENSDGLSMAEMWAIKEVLWNQGENKTVLKVGDKSTDVASFSTLVGERYLDNFVIDVSILCFLQDFKGRSKALYLPSETHTWLNTSNSGFIHRKLCEVLFTSKESEYDLLLCPLHMNQSHWGIIVIDLLHRKLMFDDGCQCQPDSSVLPSMKRMLDVLRQLSPDAHCFRNSFWASVDSFERFGMPSQRDCLVLFP